MHKDIANTRQNKNIKDQQKHMFNVSTLYRKSIKLIHHQLWEKLIGQCKDYNTIGIKPYTKSHLELQRAITLIKLAPSPYFVCCKFLSCIYEHVCKVCLKTLLQQGISEPIFYGDLVYKYKRIVGKPNFSDQFKKIVKRYIRVGYNLDIMRQSAYLVLNPFTVDSYGFLFNCTTVGQASDSMTTLT